MVEWLAGNRIRGTSAEKPVTSLQSPNVGGWVELDRTTLGSAGDTITVSNLDNKRYYQVLIYAINSGAISGDLTINNNSNQVYTRRRSANGGTDATPVDQTNIALDYGWSTSQNPNFTQMYISSLSGKEKLGISQGVPQNLAGASSVPDRVTMVFKFAPSNLNDNITRLDVNNTGDGSYAIGSEVVVLGWDPADTHTTNFWEELASVTTTSAGNIASGTITAKKYLMYSIVGKKSTGTGTGSNRLQFNGDTSAKYAQRNSINGTDYDYGGQTSMNIGGDGNVAGELVFYNGFIINNSANEKLLTGHSVFGNTAGAGQIGNRGEIANKWANTSDQITSILCMNCSLDAGAIMKVWGSN